MDSSYTWKVVSQTQDTQFDTAGNQVTGKQITFQVQPTGYNGTVFVPDAIYPNPDAVRELIQAEVDSVMSVHGLNG